MGRKNKRMHETPDRNFVKFMDSINKRNRIKNNPRNNNRPDGYEYRKQQRLKYSLK